MLLLILLMLATIQQPPANAPGTVDGIVLNSISGSPISGARIKVTSSFFTTEVVTDGGGRFLIPNTPAGNYRIEAASKGYGVSATPVYFNPVRTEFLTVASNQQARPRITLTPAATIHGRVLDESGHGIPDTLVEVLKLTTNSEEIREWTPVPEFVTPETNNLLHTNAQGEYMHDALGPGDYYVRAVLSGAPNGMPMAVYYPNTLDSNTAVLVALTEGGQATVDVDVTSAVRSRKFTVSGTVIYPLKGQSIAYVELRPRNPLAPLENGADWPEVLPYLGDPVSGRFIFRGVRPGSYDLTARVRIAELGFREHTAKLSIEVRNEDVSDLHLVLKPGIDVKGRLVIDGNLDSQFSMGPPDGRTRDSSRTHAGDVKIVLHRKDRLFLGADIGPVISQSGTSFTFPNTAEGDYEIRAEIIPDGSRPRPDLYIADIRTDGRSVFDSGFQVGVDGVDAMEIVLGTEGGSIQGRIQGAGTAFAAVIVVPEPFRRNNAALYRMDYFWGYEEFKLTGIAPGNYTVFAVPHLNQPIPYRNPEFVRQYESRGVRVVIQKSSAITELEVPLVKIEER